MKTSLRKLRGFASLHKNADLREKRDHKIPARQDELLQASQFCYEPCFLLMHWIATFSKLGAHELALGNLFACLKRPSHVYLFLGNIDSPEEDVLEMRSCYDSLLSAAAATANSAYEFSEALKEMGTCLLEKTSLNDDEESSRVLLNLGKAQFELQKLVDSYRVHIIQTITTPSESLFKELQTVEEMKRQCDDKRDIYKFILATQREKGRARHGKGESYALQQLQVARDDYEEETNLFIFRLKSLKQGQSRSLLTQASRHHAAQLNFFRKGVKALEMVEPDVKVVAEQQHIDYDFIGLEDDDTEDDEYNGYGSDANDDGELSFDYGHSEHIQDAGLTHRQSMELDQDYLTETSATTGIQLVSDKSHGDFPSFGRAPMTGSQSAPILPEMKPVLSERIKQMSASPPTRFHSYVLPTPADARNSFFAASRPDNKAEWPKQLWHSSPLEPNKPAEALKVEQSSPITLNISRPALRESGTKSSQTQLHPPAEGMLFSQSIFHSGASDNKKIKRQAFSGPLTGKSWSNSPKLSTNENIQPAENNLGPFSAGRAPSPQLSMSPRLIPSVSSFPMLPSKINELHELPRPPMISRKPVMSSSLVGYSGPLLPKSGPYADSAMLSNAASPLPTPPQAIARSFSIPSSAQRSDTMTDFLEASHNADAHKEISSPPLALISLSSSQPSKRLASISSGGIKTKGSL